MVYVCTFDWVGKVKPIYEDVKEIQDEIAPMVDKAQNQNKIPAKLIRKLSQLYIEKAGSGRFFGNNMAPTPDIFGKQNSCQKNFQRRASLVHIEK